ncbi:hypothetical protein CGLO_07265 [Colletotrichum gloeosporioides Cg-14]|uniref:DUF7918 domain-containing protein n=1 Tax=Colletotrichum gloeosporioides (strain Cg-14) TaxID=1237896 RepID=T0KCE1_COLGC|nr:hypothetical protein CGLO_07265 [Colletotrichum gloeosporioides Cg-14]
MVVIEDLPHISVTIHVTGSRDACIEYDDPEPPTTSSMDGTAQHSIFKIIESTDDAEFYIQYAIENNSDWFNGQKGIGVRCFIDGKRVESPLHSGRKALRSSIIEGQKDSLAQDKEAAQHLGVIEVIFYRVVVREKARAFEYEANFKSERAKKALIGNTATHGTAFTEGTEVDQPVTYKCDHPDGDLRLARFVFRYKSRAILENEGIIPRADSPDSPLPGPPTLDGLSEEDLRRLALERLNDLHAVKQEKNVKREASVDLGIRPGKIYKMDASGAIDLTEE